MQKTLYPPSPHHLKTRPAGKPVRTFFRLASLILALCLLCSTRAAASGEGFVTVDPYKVEAAFLRNFARYVTWPEDAFADADSPWRVGILGRDPFGDILEKTFQGHIEQGRAFETYRGDSPDQLPECNIVFIAYRDPTRLRAVLARFKGKPVLTVGEASNFLQEGGIIRFDVTDRVKMSINLDWARRASLKIQTKMLEVADRVVDQGVARRPR